MSICTSHPLVIPPMFLSVCYSEPDPLMCSISPLCIAFIF